MGAPISLLLQSAVAILVLIIYSCFRIINFTQGNVYVNWERRGMMLISFIQQIHTTWKR
jgi:hypothetical protein